MATNNKPNTSSENKSAADTEKEAANAADKQATAEAPKEESVTMTKEHYDALMKAVASVDELKRKIEFVSDKARMERWDATQTKGKSILPVAGISFIDGKPIVGWRTIMNEADFRNNIYYEKQIIEVAYEDQSLQKMDYIDFVRSRRKVSGEVIKKTQVEGDDIWTIRLPDGKEVSTSVTFLN